jgi:hypothetical protein
MSVYGFDNSLSKVQAAEATEYAGLNDRMSAIESYDRGSHGFSTSEAVSVVAYGDPAEVYKRGNLVSLAWTFDTIANIPAYTTIATLPTKFRPMQRHYFVDSTGLRMMITVTGYIQNVDALPSGKQHLIGTSYMGRD